MFRDKFLLHLSKKSRNKPLTALVTLLMLASATLTNAQAAEPTTVTDNVPSQTNTGWKHKLIQLVPAELSTVYVGAGLSNEFIHALAEKPTKFGNFYAKVGQFYDGDGVAGQIGFRYPYYLTGKDKDGVYLGAFAGHVHVNRLDGERFNRLGAGFDIAYVKMDKSRISSLSVAIYAAEAKEGKNGAKLESEPEVMLGYSYAIDL